MAKRNWLIISACLAAFALVVYIETGFDNLALGFSNNANVYTGPSTSAKPAVNGPAYTYVDNTALSIQKGLEGIVKTVRPSVVNITSATVENNINTPTGMQFIGPHHGNSTMVGSGVIIDRAGHILTSRQITGGQDVVQVTLFRSGHNTFLARKIAEDPRSDLVLLELPFGGNLPFAVLGDSSRLRTGDLVIALGCPFGLQETVTQGIVSTSSRTITIGTRRFSNVIQTDAAINQGNSGGPLIDIHAQIIGINIAIYSTDNTFSGIGFAIPSNQARAFLAQAINFHG